MSDFVVFTDHGRSLPGRENLAISFIRANSLSANRIAFTKDAARTINEPDYVQLMSDGNGRVAIRAASASDSGAIKVINNRNSAQNPSVGCAAFCRSINVVKPGRVTAEYRDGLLIANITTLQAQPE